MTEELKAAEKAGAALGAQQMEAELRPRIEAWKDACKWIAAGGIAAGCSAAVFAFIEGFKIGATAK